MAIARSPSIIMLGYKDADPNGPLGRWVASDQVTGDGTGGAITCTFTLTQFYASSPQRCKFAFDVQCLAGWSADTAAVHNTSFRLATGQVFLNDLASPSAMVLTHVMASELSAGYTGQDSRRTQPGWRDFIFTPKDDGPSLTVTTDNVNTMSFRTFSWGFYYPPEKGLIPSLGRYQGR